MWLEKVFQHLLTLWLLFNSYKCYEDEELKQALGGGLSEGFDDLMNSFGEAIDGLAQMVEGKEIECAYKCDNGRIQKPRAGHKQTSNGCGSYGIELDTAKLPQMTACCDTHDFCYDTCNTDKDKCDKDFKQCLLKMCNKMQDELNTEEYEGCQATAEIMYTGALALGCTPYKKAQKNACDCGDHLDLEHKPDRTNKSGTTNKNTKTKNVKTDKNSKTQDVKVDKKSKTQDVKVDKKSKTQDVNKDKKIKTEEKVKQRSRDSGEL